VFKNVDKTLRISITLVCWAGILLAGIYLIRYFYDLFAILAVSLAISYILLWPINAVERNITEIPLKYRRLTATIVTYCLSCFFLVIFAILLIQPVSRQLIDLSITIPKNISKIQNLSASYINNLSHKYGLNLTETLNLPQETLDDNISTTKVVTEKQITEKFVKLKFYKELENLAKQGASTLPLIVSGTLRNIIYSILIIMLSFYFILSESSLRNWIRRLLLQSQFEQYVFLEQKIHHSLIGYIRGQAIIGILTGICMWIVYIIFDLKFALILAILMGIGQFIPFLGHAIALLTALIVGFAQNPISIIFIIITFLIVQLFTNQILGPKLLGELTGLNPAVIIIALIIGERVAGLLGIFLAVPVASIIIITVTQLCPPFIEKNFPEFCTKQPDI
jgi:predicted PurR-regulated permease PerM